MFPFDLNLYFVVPAACFYHSYFIFCLSSFSPVKHFATIVYEKWHKNKVYFLVVEIMLAAHCGLMSLYDTAKSKHK